MAELVEREFNRVALVWAMGEHEFALRLGELRALQDRLKSGPDQINERIAHGEWMVDDLFEVLRLGLIGAGMSANDAKDLVIRAFDTRPLRDFVFPARMVIAAALVGVEGDAVGEDQGAENPPGNGNSPKSTGQDAS